MSCCHHPLIIFYPLPLCQFHAFYNLNFKRLLISWLFFFIKRGKSEYVKHVSTNSQFRICETIVEFIRWFHEFSVLNYESANFSSTWVCLSILNLFYCQYKQLWQYRLWSFQTGGTKLERFLHKNQHTQRKFLNFENWTYEEPQYSLQKLEFLKFIIPLFLVPKLRSVAQYEGKKNPYRGWVKKITQTFLSLEAIS